MGGTDRKYPVMDPDTPFQRFPFEAHELTEPVTPIQGLFVLAHLGIPHADPETWTLDIDGLVQGPMRLSLDDLKGREKRTVEAVHACCGSPLTPRIPKRRVVNVVWCGVALDDLLRAAEVEPSARFVWSYGLDYGDFEGTHSDSFVKDLPLLRLAAGDVLVAYEVNGRPLPIENGFPVRLVVPGFYGTNSVKWLYRMTLAERRADGPFVTTFYNDPEPADAGDGGGRGRPVWDIAPESILVHPASGANLRVGEAVEVFGWAWSPAGVRTLEISLDDGASWVVAELTACSGWSWQRFRYLWRPEIAGVVRLRSRASDGSATQPLTGARNAAHTVEASVTP
ncbi:MAG TPA: molybdopterin-dependent oxidoreductase [Candidatus Acidoferrum sp.]|nr:molybdopterin-dependent oxidoreductase [Candidatus Acidoferrum sp.]